MFMTLLTASLLSPQAQADEDVVRTCLDNKVSDSYIDGWRVRTKFTKQVEDKQVHYFLIQMTRGLEYNFIGCANADVEDLDILIYDANARLREQTQSLTREPVLSYRPHMSGSYFVGLSASAFGPDATSGSIGVAMTYR